MGYFAHDDGLHDDSTLFIVDVICRDRVMPAKATVDTILVTHTSAVSILILMF